MEGGMVGVPVIKARWDPKETPSRGKGDPKPTCSILFDPVRSNPLADTYSVPGSPAPRRIGSFWRIGHFRPQADSRLGPVPSLAKLLEHRNAVQP
jgi:hypothetical protein